MWPTCPVPQDCSCTTGQTQPCSSDPDPGISLDRPCGTETCGPGYTWASGNCAAKAPLYQDADGDGHGNQWVRQTVCPGPGWTPDDSDCDDSNPNLYSYSGGVSTPPASCTHGFTDSWASNSAYWSCARPADYDTFSNWNGMPYTFNFSVSQSGNVATDGTLVASLCCSNDSSHSTGVCTDITAAQFAAHATLSLTCPGNPSIVYIKNANGGGSCCGGYTRTITAISYTNYIGCDP